MNIFKRIAALFRGGPTSSERGLPIYVFSRRCQEPLAGRVDLYNELSAADEESGYTFYTRKVLHTSGERRCFDQVEVDLWFDRSKTLQHYEVGVNGRWLTAEEYEQEFARLNGPPDDETPVAPNDSSDEQP